VYCVKPLLRKLSGKEILPRIYANGRGWKKKGDKMARQSFFHPMARQSPLGAHELDPTFLTRAS
jgi:hypothetical protein